MLVRGAYSANVKERRDLSTALFDADGRLVAQAAHIPVHLGAMPDAVAAVRARDPRPGRRLRAQRPVRRRHAPARRHARLAGRRRRARCSPTPSRAPTTPTSAACARARSRRPPRRSCRRASSSRRCGWCGRASWWRDVLDLMLANVRTPGMRRGDLRAQLAAAAVAQERLEALVEPGAAATSCGAPWRPRGLRRAALAGRGGRAAGRHVPRRGRAGGRRHRRATTSRSASRSRSAARSSRVDFAGTAPADPRQRQLRHRRHPLGLRLRAARGAARRHPDQRRACTRRSRCEAPAGLPRQRPAPVGRRRGQHGDVAAHRRHRAGRAGAGGGAAGAGPGHDEQPRARRRGLDVLRDHRRRAGRRARSGPGDSGVHVGMSNALNTPVEALRAGVPAARAPLRARARHAAARAATAAATASCARSRRWSRPRSRWSPSAGAAPRAGPPAAPTARAGENLVNGEQVGAKVAVELAPGDVVTVRTPGGGGWGVPAAGASAAGSGGRPCRRCRRRSARPRRPPSSSTGSRRAAVVALVEARRRGARLRGLDVLLARARRSDGVGRASVSGASAVGPRPRAAALASGPAPSVRRVVARRRSAGRARRGRSAAGSARARRLLVASSLRRAAFAARMMPRASPYSLEVGIELAIARS